MARAMGAKVEKNNHWEVRRHPVEIDDAYLGNGRLTAFQWHQDTFELPEGAVRIATTGPLATKDFACRNVLSACNFTLKRFRNGFTIAQSIPIIRQVRLSKILPNSFKA